MTSATQNGSSLPRLRTGKNPGLDRIQIGLILLFSVGGFIAAILNRLDIMADGHFASLTFIALAASITLYYFLDTIAEIRRKDYSVMGAGAIFFLIIPVGYVIIMDTNKQEAMTLRQQIKEIEQYAGVRVQGSLRLETPPTDGFRQHQVTISRAPPGRQTWPAGENRVGFSVQVPYRLLPDGLDGQFESLIFEYPDYRSKEIAIDTTKLNDRHSISIGEVTLKPRNAAGTP